MTLSWAGHLAGLPYSFVNLRQAQIPAMKPDRKRGGPVGGLIAGILLLGVVGLGLVTGYMPLAGASNQGIELERWPLVFWAYATILGTFGIAVFAWSVWAFAKVKRDS